MLAPKPLAGRAPRFILSVVPVPETVAIVGEVTSSLFKGSSCLTILSR